MVARWRRRETHRNVLGRCKTLWRATRLRAGQNGRQAGAAEDACTSMASSLNPEGMTELLRPLPSVRRAAGFPMAFRALSPPSSRRNLESPSPAPSRQRGALHHYACRSVGRREGRVRSERAERTIVQAALRVARRALRRAARGSRDGVRCTALRCSRTKRSCRRYVPRPIPYSLPRTSHVSTARDLLGTFPLHPHLLRIVSLSLLSYTVSDLRSCQTSVSTISSRRHHSPSSSPSLSVTSQ